MGKKHLLRHKVRRKLEQSMNLCNNINQHLGECAQPYKETHKNYYDAFIEIGTVVENARKMMEAFLKVI